VESLAHMAVVVRKKGYDIEFEFSKRGPRTRLVNKQRIIYDIYTELKNRLGRNPSKLEMSEVIKARYKPAQLSSNEDSIKANATAIRKKGVKIDFMHMQDYKLLINQRDILELYFNKLERKHRAPTRTEVEHILGFDHTYTMKLMRDIEKKHNIRIKILTDKTAEIIQDAFDIRTAWYVLKPNLSKYGLERNPTRKELMDQTGISESRLAQCQDYLKESGWDMPLSSHNDGLGFDNRIKILRAIYFISRKKDLDLKEIDDPIVTKVSKLTHNTVKKHRTWLIENNYLPNTNWREKFSNVDERYTKMGDALLKLLEDAKTSGTEIKNLKQAADQLDVESYFVASLRDWLVDQKKLDSFFS